MPLRGCRPARPSGRTSTSTRSSETLGSAGGVATRHDVIVGIEALARDDDQQSHRCRESAARARRSGTPRRPPGATLPPGPQTPPCRCRGSAHRDRFRTTSSDASHAPSRTISPPPSARSLLRFSWSTACQRNCVKSITRADRAARPQCDRERSSASGPALMSRGVGRRRSRQSPFARGKHGRRGAHRWPPLLKHRRPDRRDAPRRPRDRYRA